MKLLLFLVILSVSKSQNITAAYCYGYSQVLKVGTVGEVMRDDIERIKSNKIGE